MKIRYCQFLSAIFFLAFASCLTASAAPPVFDATNLHGPSEIMAQCLVHVGDDPSFARPDFDDSQWTPFDPATALDKIYGNTRPPIVWYRLRIKVDPAQKNLALDTINLSHAFEIYVNGERLITSGQVSPLASYTYDANIVRKIPERQLATGTLLVAMRVYTMQSEWAQGGAGYGSANLLIGQYDALQDNAWLQVLGRNLLGGIAVLFYLALAIVALVLYRSQRKQVEYLWLVGVCALSIITGLLAISRTAVNVPLSLVVLVAALQVTAEWLEGYLYFSLVRQRVGWRWRAFFVFAGVMSATSQVISVYYPNNLAYAPYMLMPALLLGTVIIPIVLIQNWRKGNREAGILLIPVALSSLNMYALFGAVFLYSLKIWQQTMQVWIARLQSVDVGPLHISGGALGEIFFTVSMGVIILLRSSRMSQRQAQLDAELEAAQQVQQVLVPEKTASVPGFAVDAVYLPAQQVGGDFFQVLPMDKGGLLVVVGDVAGKGLPAAMMVSALVGSIRTAADDTHDPGVVLHRLNERLVGRTQGGFSTALAAYIASDGTMAIANAGHLSPYLDGREVELAGALPLGIASGVRYETKQVVLPAGARLTFYSDGVIEAQNAKGELLGFDRAREISSEPASEIARQAQQFGQQDDITVVTIQREKQTANAA